MTDQLRGGVPGEPWSVDLLADLRAGALDPDQDSHLRSLIDADPAAQAVLDALDAVAADLRALAEAPAPPMPAHFAARLDAAIAAEARTAFGPSASAEIKRGSLLDEPPAGAPVLSLADARRKRTQRLGWGAGLVAAAAAAVAVAFAVLPGNGGSTGGVAASIPSSAQDTKPIAVRSDDLGGAVGLIGTKKAYGPLRDQAGLDKCVTKAGLDPVKSQTIGVHPVTLDGKDGVMALLTTGEGTKLRILTVTPDCTVITNVTLGR